MTQLNSGFPDNEEKGPSVLYKRSPVHKTLNLVLNSVFNDSLCAISVINIQDDPDSCITPLWDLLEISQGLFVIHRFHVGNY